MNIPYLDNGTVEKTYLRITDGGMWDGDGVWTKSIGKWYFNPTGPFKWKMNQSGWVIVRKPSILKVLGERRFGWREYRLERDGMLKQTDFKDFTSKEEAEKSFKALNRGDVVVESAMSDVKNTVASSSYSNSKFKVGDRVSYYLYPRELGTVVKVKTTRIGQTLYDVKMDNGMTYEHSDYELTSKNSCRNAVVKNALAWKRFMNMSSDQKSMQLIIDRSEPVVQYMKVLPGKVYFRRLGRIYMCDDNDLNRKALEVQGFRVLPYEVGGLVGN